MIIVPDNILEELTCDFCHKYLSVGSVKVDSHGRKKCGRCAVDKSDATSIYQFFGENAIFKCINRFDGCEELLTYGEAINHEKECLSNKYGCPLCEHREELETYELLNHFKEEHNKSYLKNATLRRKLDEIQTVNKFIFMKDNFIFFIYIEYEKHTGTLSFNSFYIGGRKQVYDIHQKYYVHIDGLKTYETNQRNCLSWQNYDLDWRMGCSKIIGGVQNDSYLVINFEFHVPVKIVDQIIKKNDIPVVSFGTGVTASKAVQCKFNETSNETSLMPSKSKSLRYIYVDKEDQKKFKISNWSISPCRQKLLLMTFDGEIEIAVHCKICSNLGDDIRFITSHGTSRQLLCHYCVDIVPTGFMSINNILTPDDTDALQKCFQFSCIWNCETLNNYLNIQNHEVSCEKNPGKKCPYKNCSFNGVFQNMKLHLFRKHGKILCYKYFNLMFGSGLLKDHDINILHSDLIQHYVLTHDNVFLKCRITRKDKTVIVEVKSDDNSMQIEGIKFFIWSFENENGKYLYNQKYNRNFLNKSDKIDLAVLPIRVCLVNQSNLTASS